MEAGEARPCNRCKKFRPLDWYDVDTSHGRPFRRGVCRACRKRDGAKRVRDQSGYHRARRATPLGQLIARKHRARAKVKYWQEVEREMDRQIAAEKAS